MESEHETEHESEPEQEKAPEPKTKRKRVFNEKGLETIRANLAKGRAMRMETIKARKAEEEQKQKDFDNYQLEESESESESEEETVKYKHKKPKAIKSEKNKEKKLQDRLDKTDKLLAQILQAQKDAKRKKNKPATIVQIPKPVSVPAKKVEVRHLLNLFN